MPTGVLLTGFGGPDSIEAVGPFMCNLTGREPSPELLERVCGRYSLIGGSSPLNGIARAIAESVSVETGHLGSRLPVAVGMRYWHPFIAEGLGDLVAAGCDRVITLSLSAFESKVTHGAYREAIAQAAGDLGGLEILEAPLAASLPEYAGFFASAAADALAESGAPQSSPLVFTAHSLPETDLVDDDPYVAGLEAVADAVAQRLGLSGGRRGAETLPGIVTFGSAPSVTVSAETALSRPWLLAYQSKGERPGKWLGPDLADVIAAVAAAGTGPVAVCPIGFMTDHMETLYDLDMVAAGAARDAGVGFFRTAVPNDDAGLCAAMARMVLAIA